MEFLEVVQEDSFEHDPIAEFNTRKIGLSIWQLPIGIFLAIGP